MKKILSSIDALIRICSQNPRPFVDRLRSPQVLVNASKIILLEAAPTEVKKAKLLKVCSLLVLIISMFYANIHGYFSPIFTEKTNAQSSIQTFELDVNQDIFVSSSSTNGNRRMLLAGTYTDYTICLPEEGCPPTFSESISLLNFNWNALPANAIVLSAKLKIYHYGSNSSSPFNIKASSIDSAWNEATNSLNSPNISGNFGITSIPNFNTNNSSEITLREINIDGSFFDNPKYQNGIALSAAGNLSDLGIVFCSKDSDAFCLPSHRPKLILSYVPNNPPQKPKITTPVNNFFSGGNCDYSADTLNDNCTLTKNIPFAAKNLIDNDPASGTFSHSKFVITSNENTMLESPSNVASPESSWSSDLENGNYSVISESYDKKGVKTSSDPINFIIDTLPPETPILPDLADITKPSQNKVNVRILASNVTDNTSLNSDISYQIQYSTDSSFASSSITDWRNSPDFSFTEKELIPSKTYFFRIKSKDKYNNSSDWSNTAVTSIEGLPAMPALNKNNWISNPFRSRTYVTNIRANTFTAKTEKDHTIELYINNKKVSQSIANQNCDGNICQAILNYNYSGQGRNTSIGAPIDFFTMQLRAVDSNQNASILSPKETIYFDNVAPTLPTFTLSSDKNLLDINSVTTTNGSTMTSTIAVERFSNLEYRLIDPKGKTLDHRVVKIPATQTATLKTNLKIDGQYKLELTSIDAAGNRSGKVEKVMVRDTVGPNITSAKVDICNDKICLEISGEIGSKIIVNNRIVGNIQSNTQKVDAVKYWSYGKIYDLNIQLEDQVGNKSSSQKIKINTPIYDSGGRGAADGTTIEIGTPQYDALKNKRVEFRKIVVNVDYYKSNEEIKLTGTDIPNPVLEAAVTNYDKSVDFFGNSNFGGQGVRINVRKYYLNFNEAFSKCGVNVPCIESRIGMNIQEYFTNFVKVCRYDPNLLAILIPLCGIQSLNASRSEGITTSLDQGVDMNVYLYNEKKESESFSQEQRKDSVDERFVAKGRLGNGIESGDKVFARLLIEKIELNIEGKGKSFEKISSGKSNSVTVDPKSSIKLINGQKAKVLDVPYFNQYLEPDGKTISPKDGWKMCGAATVTMIAGYYSQVPLPGKSVHLKDYMSKDEGQGIRKGSSYNSKLKQAPVIACNDGAFGITGSYNSCSFSSWEGMHDYLYLRNIKLNPILYVNENTREITPEQIKKVKNSIDNGNPVVLSYKWVSYSFGHISVIKGYILDSSGNFKGLVLNDPYRDTGKTPPNINPGSYKLDGESSVHLLNYDPSKKVYIPETGMKIFYFATTNL